MKLYKLLAGIKYELLQGSESVDVDGLAFNSQVAKPGDVFICIKGHLNDGHDYIIEAIINGAKVIVVEKKMDFNPWNVTVVMVESTESAFAVMSSNYFDNPSRALVMIGVTGTKGKTTTTYMIKSILEESGLKCGLIGTVSINDGKNVFEAEMTTPSAFVIQKSLRNMICNGCKVAIIEVSSQGMMKKRVDDILFDYAVFTNLANDHIGDGEHNSFEEYLYWKCQLFKQCRVGIANGDDFYAKEIIGSGKCSFKTFGKCEGSVLKPYKIQEKMVNEKLGVEFSTKGVYNNNLAVPFAGSFTAYNALAAMMVAYEFGITSDIIQRAFNHIYVPGRQEILHGINGSLVIIDYAHNGKGLQSLLTSLRRYNPSRIICIFGCGGNRAKERRFQMGAVSAKLSDLTIITSDNPRLEPPMDIIADIASGVKKSKGNYLVIENRAEAIDEGIRMGKPGDFIIIAGKGHEKYQIIGNKKIHFDDVEIATKSIEKVKYEQNYGRRNC